MQPEAPFLMRLSLALFCLLAIPVVASADEYYLPIAGSVGSFRTDVRMFNPAAVDSNLTLTFLPVGNQDSGAPFLHSVHKTIPAGKVAAYDDAVATIFATTGLGAIYISADTPLLITTRIYAQTSSGTLGQGFSAERVGNLLLDGVLIQLRADVTFRTNIGAVNLQNAVAHVTWTLYDKNGSKVSEKAMTIPPYGIVGPTSITAGLFFDSGNADLSDARVTFHSDVGLGVYASVIDNITTDPTYFRALSPSGF
jgi:hypothetical protein